jgi:hypothetical protein
MPLTDEFRDRGRGFNVPSVIEPEVKGIFALRRRKLRGSRRRDDELDACRQDASKRPLERVVFCGKDQALPDFGCPQQRPGRARLRMACLFGASWTISPEPAGAGRLRTPGRP